MYAPTHIERASPSRRSRRGVRLLLALLIAVVFGAILLVMVPAQNPAAETVEKPGGYYFIKKWGSQGSGDGQFNEPSGIATDASGNVYVADKYNNRVQKFTANGTFLTKWGSQGSGDGQFDQPIGIATDASGNVYVSDYNNQRVQKFTANGNFIAEFGTSGGGAGDGQFHAPMGIATDASGNVYVADSDNHRIQKFDSSGNFITKWGTYGSANGQFNLPFGVTVDSQSNVYVTDYLNSRVQKFTSNGTFLTKWGTYGSANGQFARPASITTDASGNVYVGETFNDRVQKFGYDDIAPRVSAVQPPGLPAAGATGVSRGTNVTATFSERVKASTINKTTFKLYKVSATGTTTQITNVTVTPTNLTTFPDGTRAALKATLNPYGTSTTRLAQNTKYKAVVTTGVKDRANNSLDQKSLSGLQQKVWYFKTGS